MNHRSPSAVDADFMAPTCAGPRMQDLLTRGTSCLPPDVKQPPHRPASPPQLTRHELAHCKAMGGNLPQAGGTSISRRNKRGDARRRRRLRGISAVAGSSGRTSNSIVIPAKAGTQMSACARCELGPSFRWDDT